MHLTSLWTLVKRDECVFSSPTPLSGDKLKPNDKRQDTTPKSLPHGTISTTTAGAIRGQGGSVILAPELTRGGTLNPIHVNITEGAQPTVFGPRIPNPVPRPARIQ
jgi:hypothetical protein